MRVGGRATTLVATAVTVLGLVVPAAAGGAPTGHGVPADTGAGGRSAAGAGVGPAVDDLGGPLAADVPKPKGSAGYAHNASALDGDGSSFVTKQAAGAQVTADLGKNCRGRTIQQVGAGVGIGFQGDSGSPVSVSTGKSDTAILGRDLFRSKQKKGY